MSTLVGLVKKNDIWLAADSQATAESGEIHPALCKKIFRNGEFLIGFIGSVRGGQILYPEYFKPPKNIFDLPDAIITQCAEKGCLGVDENQMSICGCNYLIAYKKRLYRVMIDFQMTEVLDYVAIGSGESIAYGSLKTTENFSDITSTQRLVYAIEAAKEFDAATGGEIQIEKY